jgi:protein-arginine kinase activator protein McsA
MTTEEFINKAKSIHGDNLDYSLVKYIDKSTKVTIICPIHGEFEQSPESHYKCTGCPICAREIKYEKRRQLATQKFLTEAPKIHNNKYDYSKVLYKEAKECVTITCPVHGDFEQRPFAHLKGQGCPDCGSEQRNLKSESKKTGIKEFIKRSTKVHGNIYDYSDTVYISARDNLSIICPIHGEFHQRPNNHLTGQGCPKCTIKGYSDTEWELLGTKSKYFTGFKVYILECWSDTEHFIKIGKTFTNISKRFATKTSMPYEWKLLYLEEGSAKHISEKERLLQKSKHSYKPKRPFNGQTECFTLKVKEQLPMMLK